MNPYDMGLPNLEAMFWTFVHQCEPWLWYVKDAAAAIALVLTLFLPYKVRRPLLALRFIMLIGMMTIAYSWANTAFGPIGDIIFWVSYAGFRIVQIAYFIPQMLADMRAAGPSPEKVVLSYLVSKLPASFRG